MYPTLFEENSHLDFQISTASNCEALNNYVKQFHWYIPAMLWGDQYKSIKAYMDTGTGNKDAITEVIQRTLFDTRILAIHMEALYKKLPYLKDFSFLIDHGIVLYLQYDYAGAINTLIPVIEGVLRNYLRTKGNTDPSFRDLKNSFDLMKADIIAVNHDRYVSLGYSVTDYQPLLVKYDTFLSKWFSFIKDFIASGMYLDTRSGVPGDYLNRHLILHGLSNDIYYNFSNAMKTYLSIQYLAWIFIQMTPGFSVAPDIKHEEYDFRDKIYEAINKIALEHLNELKHKLYKGHVQYKIENYFK